MTEKQKRLCLEYIKDLNATAAALRAGYSAKTAYSQGQRLLKKVEAQKEIQRLMDNRAKKAIVTAENILESILDIRNTCAAKYDIVSKVDGKKLGETMIDIQGAIKANELLGKHLKLFTDRLEVEGEINTTITIEIGGDDD
jgi:phage terminase small subunit